MDAVIVCMPFASIRRPSLQGGLLAAIARAHGFHCDTLHLNLDLATAIDLPIYEALCQYRGHLLGEWLFSLAAFGDRSPDPDDRFPQAVEAALRQLLPEVTDIGALLGKLRRENVPRFLADATAAIEWQRYDVIGFTSTFQQHVASLAMGRRIRSVAPRAKIVFGGANLEGSMGLETVRAFDVVDFAVSGEGDEAWPALLKALAEGTDPFEIPGVIGRCGGAIKQGPPPRPFERLDANPTPDFTEYFARAETSGLLPKAGRRDVQIPFESARGCWWGAKSHCTFCGLNGKTMRFRAKSPARTMQELGELASQTRSFNFEAVDNILDPTYLDAFFTEVATRGYDFTFFYEVKANLDRRQIATLRAGGVKRIQPGIESLSTHVLKLMGKGATAIQNVNVLRWATYYDIGASWNILWGFPGEDPQDYASQTALIPRLAHLQPPEACGRVWMERFSPMFTDRRRFNHQSIQPALSYRYVYPSSVVTDDLAYFFDYQLEGTLGADAFAGLGKAVDAWQSAWTGAARPALTYRSAGDLLQIDDERSPGTEGIFTFEGALARAYLACVDAPVFDSDVAAAIGLPYSHAQIEDALSEFCRLGLMMKDGSRYLALALPATRWRHPH